MERNDFFSYSWHIVEEERNQTVIRAYGLNLNNENVCLVINNYKPYVYLELPDIVQWNESLACLVISKLNFLLGKEMSILQSEKYLYFKKRLYYANIDKNMNRRYYPYLKCYFNHHEHIKQLSFKIRKPISISTVGVFNLKIHEHNANPILQLTSVRKFPPTGWISFIGKKVREEDKVTYCVHEYIVKYENMTEKVSTTVAKPLLMGYDIEVNSNIPSSMPKSDRPEDRIFQISCVFSRQGGKPENYEKYLLTLFSPDMKTLGEDINVIVYDTEGDLLEGFAYIINEKQPNVIIGYNIFTFDIPYMIDRADLVANCKREFSLQGLNKYGEAKERIIEWSSSAYKNQSFKFLDAEGRIFVDLLPLVRRDYKMSNYRLKTIASHFLKDITKDPLDAKGIFKCYRLGMKGGEKGEKAIGIVGKYCVKDSELVVRLFETLTTWIALCEMSRVTNVPIFQLYTQGQQLKLFSQAYKKCTHENIILEKDGYLTKENDHYIGATIFPPIPGIYDKVVPFDFASLYPTTIIAYNISYDTLVNNDDVPDELCHIMNWEDHIGCEHDPKEIRKHILVKIIKEKDEEVKILRKERDLKKNKDKKKFYIDLIEKKIEETKPFREERSQLQKSKPKHVICAVRKYRWLKNPMGVMPEILSKLLETRATTKKEMKTVKAKLKELKKETNEYDELAVYLDVLDQRQLALKVSANSGYGCMGVRRGYLPFMPGAMCTTYMGRKAIEKAAESIQKDWQGVLVYGDTDSNYVNFPHLKTAQECWNYSLKVAEEVSKLFPKPISLAFEEKIYWRFLILTKKRYMSLACGSDGVIEEKINKKGVLLQRRDNCSFVRKIYEEVVMKIFAGENQENIIDYLLIEFNKLFMRCYSHNEFIITKSVGEIGELEPIECNDKNGKIAYKVGDYKIKKLPKDEKEREKLFLAKECKTEEEYYLKCLPAQVQLAEKMRRRGQLVPAGTRLEYVITTNGGHTANQNEKIEDCVYFSKHSQTLQIDYLYYLKQLSNPLDQVLDVIFKKKNQTQLSFTENQYKYRLQKSKVIEQINSIFSPKLIFNS